MKPHHVALGSGGLVLMAAVAWWFIESHGSAPTIPAPPAARSAKPSPPVLDPVARPPLPDGAPSAGITLGQDQKTVTEFLEQLIGKFTSESQEDHEFALNTLLPALVAQDPTAVARTVTDIKEESLRDQALDRFARLWAAQDRAAALQWADALPRRDQRETALTGLCLETATRSVKEAVETLSTHIPGDRPLGALEDLTQQWAQTDPASAQTWALANQPGPRREGLVARLAFVQAKTDPATAAALVIDELPPGENQNEAAISVLHQWAQRDLQAASNWVAAFDRGPLRDRALLELKVIAPSGSSVAPQ